MATPTDPQQKLKSLIFPFLLSLVLGVIIYFGGEAFQVFGLEALDTTRAIVSYTLGIAEFAVLAILLRRIVQYVILDGIVSSALGTPTPQLLSQISAFIIYLLAITAIVGVVFKKDLTVVLAASGAAGIVIGMALKELILDVFSGLAINLDHAIKMGDCIQLHKAGDQTIEGKVAEISWRTTRIHDRFNNIVIIPNSQLASLTITNFSQPQDFLETCIMIIFDIEVPMERAMRVLMAAAMEAMPHFALANTPPPSVAVREISAEGVRYGVYIYPNFDSRFRARNVLYQCILRHLKATGLRQALSKREFLSDRSHEYEDFYFTSPAQLAKLIKSTELFQDLAEEDLKMLATTVSMRSVPPGTQITLAGEVATIMFLVVEGVLTVEVRNKRIGTGSSPVSEILGPASLIGGSAMLSNDTYENTVYSKSSILLCEINRNVLEPLLVQKPEVAHWLSRRVAQQQVAKLAIEDSKQRQIKEDDLAAEVLGSLKRSFVKMRLK